MIRVLHSVSNMDRGGIETMLMNYYRHIDREKVQFDFIVNKQKPGDYDDEIRRLGGHIYQSPGLNPLHYPAYLRFVCSRPWPQTPASASCTPTTRQWGFMP